MLISRFGAFSFECRSYQLIAKGHSCVIRSRFSRNVDLADEDCASNSHGDGNDREIDSGKLDTPNANMLSS